MKKYFSITSVFFVFATFLFVMTGVVSGADTNNLGISDISASKFGTSYRISWHVNTTNRTYSKVYYGKTFPLNLATAEYTTNYCSTSYPCITVGDSPYQLSPNTTYYYRVATSPLSSPTLESYEYGPESTQYSFTTSANSGGSAPAVPLSLAVGLEGGTQNNVLVSWTENSTNERSIDVRRTGPGAEVITTVNVSYNYPVSFVDVAVPYADYAYSIRACNEYGCSAYTSPVNITVSSTPVPVVPTAPTSLSQTSTPGVQSITLQWIDNAGNEDRFNLERRTSGGTWSVVSQSISANSISYIDTSAVSGVSYDYRIQACLGTSCSDYLSLSGATIIAPTAPPTPQSLGASASACTATTPTVNLSWSGVTSPTGVKRAHLLLQVLQPHLSQMPQSLVQQHIHTQYGHITYQVAPRF
ncbi:MAG: Serine/threonine protein kinase [Parcubacteria group bacterium GW2011_GWF2_40_69]|nr:MAG: Serine/threonine protein kinase [Parcubacteria group bacterium GW2011_GWF2_40_69]